MKKKYQPQKPKTQIEKSNVKKDKKIKHGNINPT